jgi:lysophospholipase L1-like esterase
MRVRPRYIWAAITLLWLGILMVVEAGLRAGGIGRGAELLEWREPGVLVDNEAYTARFYPSLDEPVPVQRSNLIAAEKRPGRKRVFIVGGSTAQGFPFQRNHSFSGIAQAALNRIGLDVELINVGNSAMSSYYVREVLGDLRSYAPDLVVIYAGHNEYYGTPSSFSGGTHLSRLVLLQLKKYRTVQLMERAIVELAGTSGDTSNTVLMERRFGETLFPADTARDRRVTERFVRNLDAGLRPLLDRSVPAIIFEPVSNLISMPPFRSPAAESADRDGSAEVVSRKTSLDEYRRLREEFVAGSWNRGAWEEAKDLDQAPFRARSVLVAELERYARDLPAVTWIPTGAELERRHGPAGFSDTLFIDHLHFNFDGQRFLGELLAAAVAERFHPGNREMQTALQSYFADPEQIRADIHLTDYWEFEAYTRIANLHTREPFASMPLPRRLPQVPERVMRNPLFQDRAFLDSLRNTAPNDLFFIALDLYRQSGNRDEWIRNMNAYIHIFAGHYQSHLAYGVALLEDDARANLEPAGAYIRRAYALSNEDPEVVEVARQTLVAHGLGSVWEPFRARYLE